MFRQKVHRHSITRHWLVNSLGVVIVILLCLEIVAIFMIKNYYYSYVEQFVTNKMNVLTTAVSKYARDSGTNYGSDIRSIVENYDEKEKIELMAINLDEEIALTSSGFTPADTTDKADFYNAKKDPKGLAVSTFKLNTGEKVLACTAMISPNGSEYQALRMVVSLSKVDNQILFVIVAISALVVCIIVLMVFSGLFFIKSIVRPVRDIGQIARQFATGDFSERIEKKSNDELGELCDSVNFMANELSSAEQMKNEFISSVSHELRTPLTAIRGWSETLTTIDDKETFIKGMRVITSETERLSQMVEELLDFSRIQDGRLTLSMATIDILAELGETVLIYQESARELGITLEYYEPEMLPFVHGDKNRLRQVFINVVDNAIKYSNEGDKVSIEAYEEGKDVVITVSDTGIGIAKEDLPKIKTKFYKANQTRRGSGIGLAVADEIIQMHNGTLTIKSEQNVGTTVMITIPFISPISKKKEKDTVNVELITTEEERNTLDEQSGKSDSQE